MFAFAAFCCFLPLLTTEAAPIGVSTSYQIIAGHKFPSSFSEEAVKSALNYHPKEGDIFIATYPKSGTTWTRQIVSLLLSSLDISDQDLAKRSIFLERDGADLIDQSPKPSILATHIPLELLSFQEDVKYIVVVRNPKDAVVSKYKHMKARKLLPAEMTFQDYLPLWLDGEVAYGSYFDYLLGWWEKRSLPNVEFFLYEEMIESNIHEVLRMAEFVGGELLVDKLLNNGRHFFEGVLKRSSFESMKETTLNKHLTRKGIVGDWRNYFNEQDNQLMAKAFQQKFDKTGLERLWERWEIFSSGS